MSRKEPFSMKIRVANMKPEETQSKTRQLEEESRKMEERLKELKMAMNKEKEQREQRGGGHWKTGKVGNLASHAKDVLSKPPSKPKPTNLKPRKIKVLKDDPVVIDRNKEPPKPGTLAFMAQRDTNKSNITNGPICGQCEIKSAVATCQECEEIYCSQCFTAFHLKGALAKHHSVPLTKASIIRKRDTPSSNQSSQQSRVSWDTSTSEPVHDVTTKRTHREIVTSTTEGDNSLMNGQFDEEESANSFQAALNEWRGENKEPLKPVPPSKQSPRKQVIVASPVQTPRVNVDEGTSMLDNNDTQNTYEPEFHSSVSYAEKLLLKQNRRSEAPSITGTLSTTDGFYAGEEVDSGLDVTSSDEVDFGSFVAAVKLPAVDNDMYEDGYEPGTVVNIQEIDEADGSDCVDEESHCIVVEEEGTDYPITSVVPAPLSTDMDTFSPRTQSVLSSGVNHSISPRNMTVSQSLQIEDVTDLYSPPSIVDVIAPAKSLNAESEKKLSSEADSTSTDLKQVNCPTSKKVQKSKRRPGSASSHRSSPRPVCTSRAGSVMRSASRNNNSFNARPRPRTAAEKAADMYGEGVLTKRPSAALKDIIAQYKQTSTPATYQRSDIADSLGKFFTVGVQQEFRETTIMPSRHKTPPPGTPLQKHQMSNKVYALSGKSWKPDSSLADTINDEQIEKYCQEVDLKMPEMERPLTEREDTTISYRLSSASEKPDSSGQRNITHSHLAKLNPRLKHVQQDSRVSTPIVVDGDDMTQYDSFRPDDDNDAAGMNALNDLEYELASNTGRLTADGRISRLVDDLDSLGGSDDGDSRPATPQTHRDIDMLRESMMDDFEETELLIMQDEAMRVSLL